MSRRPTVLLGLAVAIGVGAGLGIGTAVTEDALDRGLDRFHATQQTARAQATELTGVRLSTTPGGYDRDLFGPEVSKHDHDRDGCVTRDDVLQRDLRREQIKPRTGGCVVLRGQLTDPYTGWEINFERGTRTSSKVQIDHVVSLKEAWRSGAASWTDTKRQRFAGDERNLLAVHGPLNAAKRDLDASGWTPHSPQARCDFARRVRAVKTAWQLSTDPTEERAIAAMLNQCPRRTAR